MCMMDLHVSHQTAHKKRRYLGHVFCALMYPLRFLTSESVSGGEYANSSKIMTINTT